MEGIIVKEEHFEEAQRVKKLYEEHFVSGHKDLKKLVKEMKQDDYFKGKAKEGVMELLDILTWYYQEIIDAMEGYYDTFKKEEEGLEEVERKQYFTEVQG